MDRLQEIELRLAEIASELEAPEADLTALKEEVRNLKAEQKELQEKAEQRKALLEDVQKNGKVVKEFLEDKNMEEKRTFAVDSVEYREAYMKNLMGKDLDVEERAAITATAAIPTQTMNDIVSIVEAHPILGAIDLTYIPGFVSYPAESAMADAAWTAMATAATDSTANLSAVTLSAYKLIKTVEITADVANMSIPAFEGWLVRRLGEKITRALAAAVLTGAGTNAPTGILTTVSTATGTFTKAGMTYKDLMKIIGALPTEHSRNATFVMSRTLFFGDVLGMTDNANNKVCVADAQSPAKFNILGYPVIIEDGMTADNLIFGDLKAYKMNISNGPSVDRDESAGFRAGTTVYRAMALADGKLAMTDAVVRYNRAAA